MKEQNYSNHTKIVYGYYITTGIPILILAGFSIAKLFGTKTDQNFGIAFLLISWILLNMLLRSRSFALKAQDRAIRAEENLRYFMLTGKKIDPRITLRQIIALRFASDEEFPALADKAVKEGLSNRSIKKEVRNWRADLNRV